MSPGGRLTSLACNLTKKVNKAEELTYLSTDIDVVQCLLRDSSVSTYVNKK
jgi:hypothetical protein